MYFHEIAGELKTLMEPAGRGGEFVRTLVGLSLRPPMTDEEDEAAHLHEYNLMEKNISINMLDQIFEGRDKYISKARAGIICSLYDGADLADQIDALFDGNKEHLQKFLYMKGLVVEIDELGSAVQDILDQIFRGLARGIHDIDIKLTIHDPKPSIKNLAGYRIYCDNGKLYIDGDVIDHQGDGQVIIVDNRNVILEDINFEAHGVNEVTYYKDEKDGHVYGFMPSWRKALPKESV